MKRHSGVSPVIATVIILAVTVTLGIALWSFVNSEVNTSTEVFANEVTDYINYLNDRFIIVNIAFSHDAVAASSPPDNFVSVWIYNNGNLPLEVNAVFFGPGSSSMKQVEFWSGCLATDCMNTVIDNPDENLEIPRKTMGVVSFDCAAVDPPCSPLTSDTTYYVKVLTESGANQSYFQKNGG